MRYRKSPKKETSMPNWISKKPYSVSAASEDTAMQIAAMIWEFPSSTEKTRVNANETIAITAAISPNGYKLKTP